MKLAEDIEKLKSNTFIEKNEYLKNSFVELLNKLDEVTSLHNLMYSMVDNVRQELNLNKNNSEFYISFEYKKSATPELRLNFSNFFYNPINQNFSQAYYNLGSYESFLSFTLFMNKLNEKIQPHMQHFVSSASQLCNLYHIFIKELFKFENESHIKQHKEVLSFFKERRLKKENLKDFIEHYKKDKYEIQFKKVDFNNKELSISFFSDSQIKTYFSKLLSNNSEYDRLIQNIENHISKNIIIYYKKDFSESLGANYEIDSEYYLEIEKFYNYINMQKNLKDF